MSLVVIDPATGKVKGYTVGTGMPPGFVPRKVEIETDRGRVKVETRNGAGDLEARIRDWMEGETFGIKNKHLAIGALGFWLWRRG